MIKILSGLAAKEIELSTKILAVAARIEEAEIAAGEAFLADQHPDIGKIERLRSESAALDRAIATIRAKRPDVIRSEWVERAREIRKQSAEKAERLEAMNKKLAKLWREVCELQAVDYPLALLGTNPALGIWAVPRTTQLEQEVGALEQKASDLESGPVPSKGFIDLMDVVARDVILQEVLTSPSASPSAFEVMRWLDQVEATAREKNKSFGDLPRRVRIDWDGGQIDFAASYVQVRSLIPPLVGGGGFDIAAGTFRAVQ